jgi:hypothetical protein
LRRKRQGESEKRKWWKWIENELASLEERLREVMQDNFILAEEVKRVE